VGDAQADPEGLVEGEVWGPLHWEGFGGGPGLGPSPETKLNFGLKMTYFGEF